MLKMGLTVRMVESIVLPLLAETRGRCKEEEIQDFVDMP